MPSEEITLLAVERQRIIRSLLDRDGVVRSADLRDMLGVSAATVRADLRELEKEGMCDVIWGGAISRQTITPTGEVLLRESEKLQPELKRRIGERAAQLVENGQTIIVDAGSTTVELVRHLPLHMDELRVVTPALNVAVVTAQFPHIELVMTGGVLRHLTNALIGPQVVAALETVNADWVFIGTGGFSLTGGVTTSYTQDLEIKRAMTRRAAKTAVLADSSKHGIVLPLTITPMTAVDVLVTDDGLTDDVTNTLVSAGVEVVRVRM